MSDPTMTQADRRNSPDAGSAPESPVSTGRSDNVQRSRWWPFVLAIGVGLLGWAWQSAGPDSGGSADEASVLGTKEGWLGSQRSEAPSTTNLGAPSGRPQPPSSEPKLKESPALSNAEVSSAAEKVDTDELYRQRIVGRWETDRSGKRVLTVRGDGTATMVVEPEGAWSYLFGSRLTFQIEWTIEDGELIYSATGGTPENKIKLVTEMWGNQRRQTIRKLSEDRLILIDEDGGPDHDWKRIE